jgi:anti-sigma B factor antagonist
METLRIERQQHAVILTLPKEITSTTAQEIRLAVNESIEADDFELMIVDMTDLQTINSSGIGLLVSVKTKCRVAHKKMFLANLIEPVLKTLEIVQLDSFFTIVDSVGAAFAAQGRSLVSAPAPSNGHS